MKIRCAISALALAAGVGLPAAAQQAETQVEAPPPTENVAEATAAASDEALLTDADLQTLMAPVALYPDTLLIQILVGATAPFDVLKADRLLLENPDADADTLKPVIEAEGFDELVEVLAVAFPDIIGEMAEHIDWTETVGTAMLAQSDDVLEAIQVLRDQAIETGALIDFEQQVVSRDTTSDAVIIQPADPQVVYVPQYEPSSIWGDVGSVVTAGVITYGAVSLIDEIFDDDDDWDDYWGCRNCGGWGGGPIIRDPDIDIDIDGNVNIGNQIDIDRDKIEIDRDKVNIDRDNVNIGDGNLGDRRPERPTTLPADVGWKPDPDRATDAKSKIADKRGEGGKTTLPIEKPSSRDDLRAKLSTGTGAADISRPGNREGLPQIDRGTIAAGAGGAAAAGALANANRPANLSRPSAGKEALKKKSPAPTKISKPSAPKKPTAKPAVKRPSVSKPSAPSRKITKAPVAKKSSGAKAKAASSRGGKARAKAGKKRR